MAPSTLTVPSTAKRVRLALALSTSGFVLCATSAGPWAFWICSLLWAVPALIALRCLPMWIGLVVAVVPGALGRAVAFRYEQLEHGVVVAALLASVVLVPALVVDRVLYLRVPRLCIVAWPALVSASDVAAGASGFSALVAPLPDITALTALPAALPSWAPVFFTGLVAQGWAALGTPFNMTEEPLPREARLRAVRWSALTAFIVLAIMGLVAVLW